MHLKDVYFCFLIHKGTFRNIFLSKSSNGKLKVKYNDRQIMGFHEIDKKLQKYKYWIRDYI